MYSFPNLEPVCCSKADSNYCFLTCMLISQEAGLMIWYSHLLKNPQFVVIHTVKGFSIVNEAKVDIFLEFSCLFYDPTIGNLLFLYLFVSIYISLSCQDLYHISIFICISISVSISRPYLYLHIYPAAPAASI